jgi:hypothetical protein
MREQFMQSNVLLAHLAFAHPLIGDHLLRGPMIHATKTVTRTYWPAHVRQRVMVKNHDRLPVLLIISTVQF